MGYQSNMLFHLKRVAVPQLVCLCLLLLTQTVSADAYSDARAELVAAYQAEDFAAMRRAAANALLARPGYPGAIFNRALAEVLDGDSASSLSTLMGLAESGVDYRVAEAEEFAPLQALDEWPDFERAIATLNEPVGSASIAYVHDVPDFVPEGIAVGSTGELYLGSIRHGQIVRIDDGATILSSAGDYWSVFGMRLNGTGELWFTSASVPEYAGVDEESRGRTGLFRLDLDSQEITHSALLPRSEEPKVLGDLILVDDDTILATESLTGALYRYSISRAEFSEVVGVGALRSMQGLVLDESGDYLYVADYVGGLFRVSLTDNSIARVRADDSISLFGIDGLYRYGDELIAIQNGIQPHRVVAFSLAGNGLEITGSRVLARNLSEFDEPTLGQVVGDEFYFVANSHWNRFDRDGNLPDGLSGPMILRIEL
jgi:sugar lactone lactonase YvrE